VQKVYFQLFAEWNLECDFISKNVKVVKMSKVKMLLWRLRNHFCDYKRFL